MRQAPELLDRPLNAASAIDALALGLLKVAVGLWVLHQGFTHVSDDDYARTVIAEQFAHAPKLDPSGTSWLPFPFWIDGSAMATAGRSLEVARSAALVLGCVSVAAPYLAMRVAGIGRAAALLATGLTLMLPWNAWLGVATVPEGWAGALIAAGVIAMGSARARPWAAAALLAGSLARYEAWPACAMLVCLCGCAARRGSRRREIACAVVAAAGPLAWMAWNSLAHGSAFHFLARVSTFRHAIGAADVPLRDKLLGYPRALVVETPEVALLGAIGLLSLAEPRQRALWRWPLATAAAILLFLVAGDVGDGAPTHHPVRALAATWWVLVGAGVSALGALGRSIAASGARRLAATCIVGSLAIGSALRLAAQWREYPGQSASERRDVQIARGLDMKRRGVHAASLVPCAFEHFALLAAWAEPEGATVAPASHLPVTDDCPTVTER